MSLSGLKGLRFTQHHLWWQRDHMVSLLPWLWDDTSDDELAVAEAIRATGVIGGDSIGETSDVEQSWERHVRDSERQRRQWQADQRRRQIERERIAAKEWKAEEERRTRVLTEWQEEEERRRARAEAERQQSAERERRWVAKEEDWRQLERLADYLGDYLARNQSIPPDPPDEIHATFKRLVGDLIRHEGKTFDELVRYFHLNSASYIKRCIDELAANDNKQQQTTHTFICVSCAAQAHFQYLGKWYCDVCIDNADKAA